VKFSVVTPSYNGFRYLERTAHSVLSQRGDFELQWIVVDGGSADGTHDFLRSLAGESRVTWASEPDRGQSHAINKGLALADGDVLSWLNSDDLYAPGALQAVADAFRRNDRAAWVAGRCNIVDFAEREIRHNVTRYKDHLLRRYSFRRLLRENFISQPAVFWRRDFGAAAGPLDESLHYTMDYDLWLRMAKLRDPLVLDTLLAHFRLHGESKSGRVQREQFDEQYRVAGRHFGADWRSRVVHKLNVEKIVGAYRVMRALGW
jgi:glycosyltransferase involved in cell wall biosynthesis